MKAEIENIISDISKSLDLLSKRLNWDTAEHRLEELDVLCEDSNLWLKPSNAKKLMRDRQTLFDSVSSFKNLSSELKDLIECILSCMENECGAVSMADGRCNEYSRQEWHPEMNLDASEAVSSY